MKSDVILFQHPSLNLPFARWNGADNRDALRFLKQNSNQWIGEIQQRVGQETQAEALEDALTNMKVGGVKVSEMVANASRYASVVSGVVKLISSISSKDEMKAIAEDITHILCLIGVMCKDMYHCFQEDNAETTWRELLRHAELIHEDIGASYHRNEATYEQIYNLLCELLPRKVQFVIRVASCIAAAAWPYRERIAKWIAYNWKEALGSLAVLGGLALLGGLAYVGYKALTNSGEGGNNNRRRRN